MNRTCLEMLYDINIYIKHAPVLYFILYNSNFGEQFRTIYIVKFYTYFKYSSCAHVKINYLM